MFLRIELLGYNKNHSIFKNNPVFGADRENKSTLEREKINKT